MESKIIDIRDPYVPIGLGWLALKKQIGEVKHRNKLGVLKVLNLKRHELSGTALEIDYNTTF